MLETNDWSPCCTKSLSELDSFTPTLSATKSGEPKDQALRVRQSPKPSPATQGTLVPLVAMKVRKRQEATRYDSAPFLWTRHACAIPSRFALCIALCAASLVLSSLLWGLQLFGSLLDSRILPKYAGCWHLCFYLAAAHFAFVLPVT